MNEEICCTTNKGRMLINEWENDELYIVYAKS